MMPCTRTPCPETLNQNKDQYTADWVEKRAAYVAGFSKAPTFSWKNLREDIVSSLRSMTEGHCSFCDSCPLGASGGEDIEHLKPKTTFPFEAYQWRNLYLCCSKCNGAKGDEYDDAVLTPDEAEFSFERYFFCEGTGRILPNPAASPEDRDRAERTIRLFKLDREGLTHSRRQAIQSPRDDFRFLQSSNASP